MDFDSILDKWENRRDRGDNHSTRSAESEIPEASSKSAEGFNENALDRYLPGTEILQTKNSEEKPPVSEGRSVWLKRPVQDSLDLHGLNGREAREELGRFIRSMRRRGLRKGLVIHGKGLHSPEGSVLLPLVRKYLEMSAEVGEFGRARTRDGGSGATWFLLRQRSR